MAGIHGQVGTDLGALRQLNLVPHDNGVYLQGTRNVRKPEISLP